jgi:hypothetical protein
MLRNVELFKSNVHFLQFDEHTLLAGGDNLKRYDIVSNEIIQNYHTGRILCG